MHRPHRIADRRERRVDESLHQGAGFDALTPCFRLYQRNDAENGVAEHALDFLPRLDAGPQILQEKANPNPRPSPTIPPNPRNSVRRELLGAVGSAAGEMICGPASSKVWRVAISLN